MPSSHLPFATNSGVIIRGAVRAASNPRFSPALCYFRAFGDDLFVCGWVLGCVGVLGLAFGFCGRLDY